MILHIPHSSTHIPFRDGFISDFQTIDREILRLTDWYTDVLFDLEDQPKIVTPFSRIFCDVDRFEDDSKEEMTKFGMGVLYERTDSGDHLREVTPQLREKIIEGYYRPHHRLLTQMVAEEVSRIGKSLIIDCHSLPQIPLNSSMFKGDFRPDFNIGTHPFHTPEHLIKISKEYFGDLGYSLGIDEPYSGTIVPMEYYVKDSRVSSIMLEVNRDLYMDEKTGEKIKTFEQVKKTVVGFLSSLH